jgi:hypothetical protein
MFRLPPFILQQPVSPGSHSQYLWIGIHTSSRQGETPAGLAATGAIRYTVRDFENVKRS